jgi:hypothetical protein
VTIPIWVFTDIRRVTGQKTDDIRRMSAVLDIIRRLRRLAPIKEENLRNLRNLWIKQDLFNCLNHWAVAYSPFLTVCSGAVN